MQTIYNKHTNSLFLNNKGYYMELIKTLKNRLFSIYLKGLYQQGVISLAGLKIQQMEQHISPIHFLITVIGQKI